MSSGLRGKQYLKELTPWGVGLLIVIMIIAVGRQELKHYEIQKEISAAQNSVTDLQTKNAQLSDLLSYVKSPAYTEEQARLKFGFAKPGENVAVLPQAQTGPGTTVDGQSGIPTSSEPQTNHGKWWNYFFPTH